MLNHLISLLPEIVSLKENVRVPEPMLMVDQEQVEAYFDYSTKDSTMMAAYIYHAAGAGEVFRGCRRVVDLGCGPATQLVILAEINPDIEFVGVDLSPTMLQRADQIIKDKNLKNITLIEDDISKLTKIKDRSVDGVMSTMALHHLPSIEEFNSSFAQMSRISNSNRALYITDFSLLRRIETMEYLVGLNKNQPEYFRQDYLNSLKAAFSLADIKKAQRQYFPELSVKTTFLIPFMFVLKSLPKGPLVPSPILHQLYQQISSYNQQLFKEIYYFYHLGGARNSSAQQLMQS